MLAIRYVNEKEEEVFVDLSASQYEQVTDEDIFEMLGMRGVSKEMRKLINIFQSESEFVDSMADSLSPGTAEIYLQDSFDEFDGDDSNDVYIVFRAPDIATLLQMSARDCYKAIYRVATVLETCIDKFVEEFSVISCTSILYMTCVALTLKEDYKAENIDRIISAVGGLIEKYYGRNDRLPDTFYDYWTSAIWWHW